MSNKPRVRPNGLTKPRIPYGMGANTPGGRFWDDIVTTYELDGQPGRLRILEKACLTLNLADRVEKELARSDLQVRGSMGQTVSNGLISEQRQLYALFSAQVKALDLGTQAEDGPIQVVLTDQTASSGRRASLKVVANDG